MPRRQTVVEDIPNFLTISAENSQCIYRAPSTGKRCRNPSAVYGRGTTFQLRQSILSDVTRGKIPDRDEVRKYAELSCCRRWHEAKIAEEPFISQLVSRWTRELTQSNRNQSQAREAPTSARLPERYIEIYTPPVTRSQTRTQREEPIELPQPILPFESYKTDSKVSMLETLLADLSEKQKTNGNLYILSRKSNSGFFKAGATLTRSVEKRRENLQSCSGPSDLVKLEHCVYSQNVLRAERAMQIELQEYRRKERRCPDAPTCTKEHKDWFETDVNTIKRSMHGWSQWLTRAKPYDEHGRLRDPWRRHIVRLFEEKAAISGLVLFADWNTQPADFEQSQVLDDSSDDDDTEEEEDDNNGANGPATATASATATATAAAAVANEEEDDVCAVCLDAPDQPTTTACGHTFCAECIAHVFESFNNCPMCRAELIEGPPPPLATAEIPMQNVDAS